MTKREYLKLAEEIRTFSDAYEAAEPLISDYEYDQLMLKLKAAEAEHPEWRSASSPTQTVGAEVKREAGVTVEHTVPMLSIEDVFSLDDVISWVREVKELHPDAAFCVEQKIDGLSMSIRYKDGKMVMAETRGDGYVGEDVTANARVIPDVAEEIPGISGEIEIRGEVFMSHEDFDRVNERQEILGRKPFANPRNCAAGTLRQLNPELTRNRGLSFFVFNVQRASDPIYRTSHRDGLAKLQKEAGMRIVPSSFCRSEEDILKAIEEIGAGRGEYGYDIDGAVVKIDRIAYRDDFPAGTKYSAGHIAYKYPPEEKESVIRDVEVSVGMTGRINPTAVFDPIRLCGTTVSRATLHNQDFINSLHIGIGDTVVVYKSGEIIPKIRCSVPEKRPAGTEDFRLPDICPACGSKLVRLEDMADIRCVNPNCPAQLARHLINFAGRDAMDIKGLGQEIIRTLIANGYLKGIADIYHLHEHRDELIASGLAGREKNTDKLLSAIEESKRNDPAKLLTGLAIPGVGRTSAGTLMAHFHTMDALMAADEEALLGVPDVGGITASAILRFFADPANQNLMGELKGLGLNMESGETGVSDTLAGRIYVVTGDVTHFPNRNALSAFIAARGGKVTSSVSKKTTALINNDITSMSGKNRKAKELGIPILTEEEFLASIESGE